MDKTIGMIGFGEAAYHIAKGLKTAGFTSIIAYDAQQDKPEIGQRIQSRAAESGVTLMENAAELAKGSDYIFSLTSGKAALKVAEGIVPTLKAGQVYVDMNAASPDDMEALAHLCRAEGVLLCDAAIMGPVSAKGHKVPMLVCGDGSKDFCEYFGTYGMNLTPLEASLGGASAIKLFRSVIMKGLPQLMIESMLPAAKYGALDALMSSLNDTLYGQTTEQLADTLLGRTVIHAERRAHEMEEVIDVLKKLGFDTAMSEATKARLEKLAASDLVSKIPADGKCPYSAVIDAFLERGV